MTNDPGYIEPAPAEHSHKCVGKYDCVLERGHKAPCICKHDWCACHKAKNYGVELDFRTMQYVEVNAAYDGIQMLEVKIDG